LEVGDEVTLGPGDPVEHSQLLEHVREGAEALCELEGFAEFGRSSPRLEVGLAQSGEPRVAGRQTFQLLQVQKGDEERQEGVRDAGVAPVEDARGPLRG
jgi:hypothetical protein